MPGALNHVSASAPLKNTKLLIVTMAIYNSNILGKPYVNLEKEKGMWPHPSPSRAWLPKYKIRSVPWNIAVSSLHAHKHPTPLCELLLLLDFPEALRQSPAPLVRTSCCGYHRHRSEVFSLNSYTGKMGPGHTCHWGRRRCVSGVWS